MFFVVFLWVIVFIKPVHRTDASTDVWQVALFTIWRAAVIWFGLLLYMLPAVSVLLKYIGGSLTLFHSRLYYCTLVQLLSVPAGGCKEKFSFERMNWLYMKQLLKVASKNAGTTRLFTTPHDIITQFTNWQIRDGGSRRRYSVLWHASDFQHVAVGDTAKSTMV